jgi:O-methyltransferase
MALRLARLLGRPFGRPSGSDSPELLYLDLLKQCLTRSIFPEQTIYDPSSKERLPFDAELRAEGRDWPDEAETMIGIRRLNNIQECVVDVIQRGVQGDLIETGVWRGGATILMRAVLKAYGDPRTVWVADSFQGLPKPDPETYAADAGTRYFERPELAIPLETVKANFARYGLLDDQVRFLPGWFRDTLPSAPIGKLAVLRLDGDMYESTIVALDSLYPKVSRGGYVIVDDYKLERCRAAVDDFRRDHGISDELREIDWTGVYWQRRS